MAAKLARRFRCAALAAALLLAAASFAGVPFAGAQRGSVPSVLEGTWVHDGDLATATRTVDAAFAPTVQRLPSLVQGFARDRIRSNMAPPRRIRVALSGQRVRLTLQSSKTVVIDGALGRAATTSGLESGSRVTPRLEGGWLELRHEGEGSQLRQLFSTEPDGSQMHVDYTITGPQLAGPVRYRLEYRRR